MSSPRPLPRATEPLSRTSLVVLAVLAVINLAAAGLGIAILVDEVTHR